MQITLLLVRVPQAINTPIHASKKDTARIKTIELCKVA